MRKMKNFTDRKRYVLRIAMFCFLVCVLLAALFLGNRFAGNTGNDDLTAREVAALRERYPYFPPGLGNEVERNDFQLPYGGATYATYFLTVEAVGEWFTNRKTMAATEDGEFFGDILTYYLPVRVVEVSAVNPASETFAMERNINRISHIPEALQKEGERDEILYLAFSSFDAPAENAVASGDKLLLFASLFYEFEGKTVLSAASRVTFYLTEDEYVISMSQGAAAEFYSGRSYADVKQAFLAEIKNWGW
jgi:hypothetical protein